METLYKIVGIAIITCVCTLILKPVRPDFAIVCAIVGGIVVLLYAFSYFSNIFDTFNNIFNISGLNHSIYGIVFKIIGIGYLTEFTASICADTGNSSLGDKVLLGGKIIILVISLPIITGILDIVMELLPT